MLEETEAGEILVPWVWALGNSCGPFRPQPSQACDDPNLCPHSDIHLATLPPEHTIVFLLRLLPETPREAFVLWQVTSEDFQPVLGVLLDGQLGGQAGGPWLSLEASLADDPEQILQTRPRALVPHQEAGMLSTLALGPAILPAWVGGVSHAPHSAP